MTVKDSNQSSGKSRKRVLGMTVAVFCLSVVLGAAYAVRQRQIRSRYAHLMREALSAAKAGDSNGAMADLVPYLKRYPADPAALSLYAHLRLSLSKDSPAGVADAIVALRSVVKSDSTTADDAKLLLSLYLKAGYFNEAVETADALLAHDPDNTNTIAGRAQALIALQRWDEAQQTTHHWVELSPEDLDAHMSVLTVMRQQQQPPANIIAAGEALLKKHPSELRFRFLRGFAYSLGNDPSSAMTEFKAVAAKLSLDDEHFAQLLILQLDQAGLYDESLLLATRMYAASHSLASLDELARRYWDVGRLDDLVQLLNKAPAEYLQSSDQLLALKSLALIQLHRPGEADSSFQLLQQRSSDPVAVAWTAVLTPVKDNASSNNALAKKIVDACTAAMAQSPELPYVAFFRGDAYSRLDENELAVSDWTRAARQERSWPVPLIRTAEVLSNEGRSQAALAAANEAVHRSPQNSAAVIMLARVWATCVDQGQFGQSDELFKLVTQIQTQVPNEEQTLPIRLKLLASSGKVEEAKTLLNDALGGSSRLSESTLLRLAALSDDLTLDLREQCYQKLEREHGITPALAYAQAVGLSSAGKPEAGLALIKQARGTADPAGTALDWSISEARYLDQIGSPQALAELSALGNAYPNDSRVQRVVLASSSAWQARDLVDQTIDRFRALTGERGALWRIARGRWLITFTTDPTHTQEAIGLLNAASQIAPDLADPHLLLARAQERAGRVDLALEQLGLASRLKPREASISLYMVKLLQSQGNFEAARDRLQRVLAGSLEDAQQRQQAAILLAQGGDFQQAIDLLSDTVGQGADTKSYLLLAQLYQLHNQPSKADAICKKLMEQKPDATIIQFTADVAASEGRMGEAQDMLKRLEPLHLEAGQRELILADFATRYRETADARAAYQAAVGAAPKSDATWTALIAWSVANGEIDAARHAVDSALAQLPDNAKLKQVDKYWQLIKSVEGAPEVRAAAVALIQNPRDGIAAFDVLQAVSQSQSNPNSPERLVDHMMTVARKYPKDSLVQVVLARLCLRINRIEDAISAARSATELAPATAEPFQLLAVGNMQARRWTDGLNAASEWRERARTNMVDADLAIAACQLELARPEDAVKQLEPYVANTNSPQYSKVLVSYARAKEMLQKSSAAALMQPLLDKGAAGRLQWIAFAVQNLSDTEASTWLDRVALQIPADALDEKLNLSKAWLQLSVKAHSDAYGQKAKALLEALTASPHPNIESVVLLAMLDEHLNDPTAAAVLYRRSIEMQPDSPVAQNNLAMILCRRGHGLDEAATLCASAIKLHPKMVALYDTAAMVQLAQKLYVEAIHNQELAIQMQPDNVAYRLHLALCLMGAGRPARAGEILKELDQHRADLDRLPSEEQSQLSALRKQLSSSKIAAEIGLADSARFRSYP